ncbi:MAG: FmdB family zinc ribbon protein [Phototrophicaceae bacterium]|jgi:predicted nucleic acid-binding Zn ribbon protein
MPTYTYRRADGTTFDIRQSFSDAPLRVDPETGQTVVRVVQAAGIVFKGSGFYVNDSKGSKTNLSSNAANSAEAKPATPEPSTNSTADSAPAATSATASESKPKDEPKAKSESKSA